MQDIYNYALGSSMFIYMLTIWFEYFSVTQAYQANQRLASEQDRLPLSDEILKKERIGYFLEWLIGSLAIWAASYFLYLPYGFVWFGLSLIPLFFIRNIIYTLIANLYYDHQVKKVKRQTSVLSNYQQPNFPKNGVDR